jgi:hypothetical protein
VTSASDTEAETQTEALPRFTALVAAAKTGLRRDVEALVGALDEAELLVPLAREIPDAPLGERRELDGELTLSPHLLPDSEGMLFSALFTHPEPIEPIVSALEWTTDGDQLKLCALPARLALEMARDVIDGEHVFGAVIDAGSDSELCLTREEISSILAGRALPLLSYVAQIPADERERTLFAEAAEPHPPDLLDALERFAAANPEVVSHRLDSTFNPDRDLEPHLSLLLRVKPGADREALFRNVTGTLEGHIPPPGYLDVLFEDA